MLLHAVLSTLLAAFSSASSLTLPLSPANCSEGDCLQAFRAAVQQCASHGPHCDILLAPGRYRTSCPTYSGLYAYVRTPGAVDLSNLSDVSFGAALPSAPALLDVDYLGAGCPAIAAWHANNVTLRNIVVDTTRLPFTEGSVAEALDGGRVMRILMWDAEHATFDVQAYPWLLSGWDWFGYVGPNLTGFVSSAWDARLGMATLTFSEPDASRAASEGAHVLCKHFLNLQSWGVYGLGVTGTFLHQDIKLLSSGGMGLRCDFCRGNWVGIRASVGAGLNRSMSTTADGIHFMHHAGKITLQNSTIDSTGDDCFNTHGNFIVLMELALFGDRRRASYIDETGPGWLPEAATLLVGDVVQFYSRLTLQPLGAPTVLLAATGGFGGNATLFFQDPIPLTALPYDMLLSLDRRPTLVATGNTFRPGGGGTQKSRGMVVSALGVTIKNNTFQGLGATSILFMNGGCGAYEDYTEGPFSADVLIADNTFAAADPRHSTDRVSGGIAVVQATACTPSSCENVPAPPPSEPYPMPPCARGGSSQPPVRPHEGDPDGPGRVNEPGSALMTTAPGKQLFRNISVVGNYFTSSSRFLDLGLADGVRVEENVFIAIPGWGSPSDGALCVYGSTGFNSSATVLKNRCLNGSQPVPCGFCSNHERGGG
jgi:hypothetical protein